MQVQHLIFFVSLPDTYNMKAAFLTSLLSFGYQAKSIESALFSAPEYIIYSALTVLAVREGISNMAWLDCPFAGPADWNVDCSLCSKGHVFFFSIFNTSRLPRHRHTNLVNQYMQSRVKPDHKVLHIEKAVGRELGYLLPGCDANASLSILFLYKNRQIKDKFEQNILLTPELSEKICMLRQSYNRLVKRIHKDIDVDMMITM